MPPGVAADWNRYAYRFFCNAQYCAGLEAAGRMLADIGLPSAPALLEDAKNYREDLLRAYRWTQARSPVVRLDDGTWTPDGPAMLACFGRVNDFFPGEDGNRSWCYGVEIGDTISRPRRSSTRRATTCVGSPITWKTSNSFARAWAIIPK